MGVIFAWSRGVGSGVGGGSYRAWKYWSAGRNQSRSCAALVQAGGGSGEEGSHTALLWMELAGLQVTGGSWLKTALAQSPGLSEGEGHSRISELQLCCLLRIKKKEYS